VGSATKSPQAGLSGHGQKVRQCGGCKKHSSNLNERTGNVYENKGSLWKTQERSGNVYENKVAYSLTAYMSLKIKVVKTWQVGVQEVRRKVPKSICLATAKKSFITRNEKTILRI
jgi:hypothetical protein